jgi:hypothetical protein
VISHSLVGASQDYVERFFNQLPQTFNPTRFNPDDWARLAKIAGLGDERDTEVNLILLKNVLNIKEL